jgi:lipoprotein-releasing system permease protein
MTGPRPPRTAVEQADPNFVLKYWAMIGVYGRFALVAIAAAALLWLAVKGLKRLGRGGRRRVLWGFTALCFVALAGLGTWSFSLPDRRGSYFVLWHQIVRVGAALSATGFVVSFMSLALPWVLNRIEGRGFVSYIATRHVRASKSGFLTVISFLSIAGVLVSSFALCAVVSIMGGFGADLKRKILGNNAHIKIEAPKVGGFSEWLTVLERAGAAGGVSAATPVAAGEAMASSPSNTAGVLLRGIDPDQIGKVIDLPQNVEVGKLKYLKDPIALSRLPPDEPIGIGPGGELYLKGPSIRSWASGKVDPEVEQVLVPENAYPGVILGRELAKTLHVYVGDEVTLVSPLGDLGPMGVLPRSRRFRVAGIFYSGMYEYDASHAYVRLDVAQDFLDLEGNVTGIEVRVDDAERVETVRQNLTAAVDRPELTVRDWKEMNKNLFSALKLEKIATFIILSIAIAVASFCIICTLLLMVTEKSKEIAIMKAIGASDRAILKIFMTEGMIIGGIGTIFGVATGLVTTYGLLRFGVRLDPDVYYVDRLPISVDPVDYTLVAIAGLVITTLATIYPAVAASRLRPVDGIRYE